MKIQLIIIASLLFLITIFFTWGNITMKRFINKKKSRWKKLQLYNTEPKNQSHSLHILLATIGRKQLLNMIDSILPHLHSYDYLTVVYDAKDIDNTRPQVEKLFEDIKATCTVYMEPKNLGFWGHGIRNEWASKLAGDFILHADDDNIYYPNSFDFIRENCTNPETLYLFQIRYNNSKNLVPNPKKPIVMGNIDTASGVIPRALNTKGWWKLEYGGDGKFYEQIIKLSPETILIQNKPIVNHMK